MIIPSAPMNRTTPTRSRSPLRIRRTCWGWTIPKARFPWRMPTRRCAATLEGNPNISIVAEVDHQANAASVDLDLNPTRVIFFGNPNLGTPLMQKNQLAGLDLPQKILIYENDEGEVYAGFNNTTYLSTRHDLEGTETLPMIQGALTNLSTGASQDSIVAAENSTAELEEGIITKTVNGSCDEAYSRLTGCHRRQPEPSDYRGTRPSGECSQCGPGVAPHPYHHFWKSESRNAAHAKFTDHGARSATENVGLDGCRGSRACIL